MNESDGNDSFSSALDSLPEIICFPFGKRELENLEKQLDRIVLIYQVDTTYHRALKDIKDQKIISLLVEPSFYGRHQPTSILVVATGNGTYIFDIKALGLIFLELAKILEADQPRKVIHYSHRIADHLLHRHRISLGGIFDTFVALCLISETRIPYTLPEAISLVFGLPMEKVTKACESQRNFTARPLTHSQMRYLAKMVQLQHIMHDRLNYSHIFCAEVHRISLEFSHSYYGLRPCDVAINMAPASSFGFQLLDSFCKKTDKELEEI
ncbi:protein Exd1 homolog [Drosophila sechellia]|uniref:GM25386 n=1 Tax=Drosophila sechellia TaxID=7238 RepID=B4HGM8_DROSE|nr:protein Exd1 homolog [Drosophila sechellia]EDW41336.1 GM25386 [Drosophila sechellia]